jgi:hypothetical protein
MSGRDLGYAAAATVEQDAQKVLLVPGRGTKRPVATVLAAGLIVLASLACVSSIARADVDMSGRLEKVPSSPLATTPGGVKPLATSINGDYRCVDPYSVIGNRPFYFAIGNCASGWDIEAVAYSGENSVTHEHSYGGYIGSAYSYCGWIDTRFPVEKLNGNSNSACKNGASNATELEESSFMEKYDEGNANHDGNWVVNTVPCPEYANYRPWSSNNVEKELIRTVPAYALGGEHIVEHEPALKWRYVTKYSSTDGTGKYVMVRDDRITGGGEGNWVFVPLSCLRQTPAELPENGNERLPPPPAVTTDGASALAPLEATLNATVNPNGVTTQYTFDWGTTTNYGKETPLGQAGAGTKNISVKALVTSLAPGTTYYFRIVASSATGESIGGPVSFATPGPVEAVTGEPTGVQQEQATLNGTVKPRGYIAKYYFQYGTSTAYGHATPEKETGSEEAAHSVVTGLEPGSSYHYRLVATSGGVTSEGRDQVFTTSFNHTTPAAISEPSTGDQWVYYTGRERAVWEWTWNGSSWFNSRPGGLVAANSNPAAVRDNPSGDQWVYYVNGEDASIRESAWNGSSWAQSRLGGEAAPNTSPAVLREPGPGHQWVYYVGKSDAIWEWTWNGSSWFNSSPGGLVAANTSLAVARDEASGHQWVYYVGGGDTAIWQAEWNGSSWVQTRIGGEVAPNTNPVVLREASTGYQWVYYVGKEKAIWEWTWNGSSWSQSEVGGLVAPNTTPSAAREAGTGYQWVYYVGGGDSAIWEWTWNGSTWVSSRPGGLAAAETSPALVQPSAGYQWVYYQGSEDPITQLFWNGGNWSELAL